MTCEEFARSLPERLPVLTAEQELHAAGCGPCSALAFNRVQLAAGLRSLAREWEHLSAPPRVESALLAAFRGKNGIPAERSKGFVRMPRLVWGTSLAAAVGLIAVFLVRGNQPRPVIVRPSHDLVQLTAAQAFSGADPDLADAEGFIPLPNAAQIGADEEANDDELNIVRLELPRASMIALGYAVGDDAPSGAVEADVVLGADGMARAVRFVDE